jgi:hypothetical protein
MLTETTFQNGLTSNGSTVVEHLPHHPMVKGSSPTVTTDNGGENGENILDKGLVLLTLKQLS